MIRFREMGCDARAEVVNAVTPNSAKAAGSSDSVGLPFQLPTLCSGLAHLLGSLGALHIVGLTWQAWVLVKVVRIVSKLGVELREDLADSGDPGGDKFSLSHTGNAVKWHG